MAFGIIKRVLKGAAKTAVKSAVPLALGAAGAYVNGGKGATVGYTAGKLLTRHIQKKVKDHIDNYKKKLNPEKPSAPVKPKKKK